jgi:hypothetical protein
LGATIGIDELYNMFRNARAGKREEIETMCKTFPALSPFPPVGARESFVINPNASGYQVHSVFQNETTCLIFVAGVPIARTW